MANLTLITCRSARFKCTTTVRLKCWNWKTFHKQPQAEFDLFFLLSRTGERHQDRLLTSGDKVENEATEVATRLITDHFQTSDPLRLYAFQFNASSVVGLPSLFNVFAFTRKKRFSCTFYEDLITVWYTNIIINDKLCIVS